MQCMFRWMVPCQFIKSFVFLCGCSVLEGCAGRDESSSLGLVLWQRGQHGVRQQLTQTARSVRWRQQMGGRRIGKSLLSAQVGCEPAITGIYFWELLLNRAGRPATGAPRQLRAVYSQGILLAHRPGPNIKRIDASVLNALYKN